ncbi:hypothetical protein [Nostoc sp.]|uniref:hypothetical protein n=1 Tax=Nostoc sp. TaxID=1180 RepID=UPI002FF14AB7
MIVSLEYLYHCCCNSCEKWWTIADIEPSIEQGLFCPHCGTENIVEAIESHVVESNTVSDRPYLKNYSEPSCKTSIAFKL